MEIENSENECVYCVSDADCTRSTPYCPGPPQLCTTCTQNEECWPWPNTNCNATFTNNVLTARGQCIYCTTNAQCSGTTPFCDNTGACVGCSSNAQCLTTSPNFPVCASSGSFSGSCVQCQANTDCHTTTAPICYSNNARCNKCMNNAQCVTLGKTTCNSNGSCS